MNYIASNLRFLRKLAGLSQEQFAKRVSMNRGNIASYEKGNAEPNIAKLQRIVEYFNVDLVAFIEVDLSINPSAEEDGRTMTTHPLLNNASLGDPHLARTAQQNSKHLASSKVLLTDAIQGVQNMQLYQWQTNNQLATNIHQIEENLKQLNKTLVSMLSVQQELLVHVKNSHKTAASVEV